MPSPTAEPQQSLEKLELLDIVSVFALPGVRQANTDNPLPPADFDLSKWTPKGELPTSHMYWHRGTIEQWLVTCAFMKKKQRQKKK